MYDWSRAHPAAVCAFATEVPMKQLTLRIPEASTVDIYNPNGVTVWDVMIELRRYAFYQLDSEFSLTHSYAPERWKANLSLWRRFAGCLAFQTYLICLKGLKL